MQIRGYTQIEGVGAYLPPNVVTSDSLMEEVKSHRFGVPPNFIESIIGIKERRFCDDSEMPSDIAIKAAEVALSHSSIEPNEIDLLIFCGIERDYMEPATAHRVQNALGISAMCFDVANACHGFMNGIHIADSMIGVGAINTALICTGEKGSAVCKKTIRLLKGCKTRANFRRWIGGLTVGDAGGAMVLRKKSRPGAGFNAFSFSTDSALNALCFYYYRDDGVIDGQMLMRPISNAILKLHTELIDRTYRFLRWNPSDVDKLISHQVGWKPHVQLSAMAGVSMDRTSTTITHYDNLTSATIPVNLSPSKPKQDDKVLLLGTGSGLSICQTGVVF